MALINCPECDKEISDKVKACPNCGYPIIEEDGTYATEPQQVELTGVSIKTKPTFKKNASIAVISLIAIAILIFGYKTISEKNAEKIYKQAFNEYVDNLYLIQMSMLNGAAEAESLCNLTSQVWRNAIYEDRSSETDKYTRPDGYFVSDFNVALDNLYDDSSTKDTIAKIISNQVEVKELIKTLQAPPEGLEKCYDTVTEFYTAYKGFTDLAINPTGSLQSFNETVNERKSNLLANYEKLSTLIPDKLEE
jgi:hypothetical protein